MIEYGLVGKKLGHSFSKNFFTEKFRAENIDASYSNFEMQSVEDPEKGLLSTILGHPELRGLNVTIPFKKDVLPFLDSIDPLAAEIGAVNTIRINRDTDGLHLCGFNTDIIGFTDSIRPLLKPNMPKKALILGTGGASLAICVGMRRLGFEVVIVSRRNSDNNITYADLNSEPSILREYGVIVNCTPLGMWPDIDYAPDIPYSQLTSHHLLYDLVYNPDPTEFMKRGKSFGAQVCSGRAMLIGQALASWQIWNQN